MAEEKSKGNIITVKTDGIEKAGILMRVITGNVNFKKKFRMTIEYDPELPNAKIRCEETSESSCSIPQANEVEAKLNWLKSIGAAAFPEPIKYIYTFPDYNGAFNLSERYIAEKTLEELKAQYEKNKEYVQEIIRSKKSQDALLRGAEPF